MFDSLLKGASNIFSNTVDYVTDSIESGYDYVKDVFTDFEKESVNKDLRDIKIKTFTRKQTQTQTPIESPIEKAVGFFNNYTKQIIGGVLGFIALIVIKRKVY